MTGDAGGWLITDRLFGIAERDADRELVVDPVYGRISDEAALGSPADNRLNPAHGGHCFAGQLQPMDASSRTRCSK